MRKIFVIACMVMAPLTLHAQKSGTGAQTTETTLMERLNFLSALAEPETTISLSALKQAAWNKERADLFAKLHAFRIRCYEELREANRDELLPILLRCYRSDLLQEIAIVRKERSIVASLTLLPESTAVLQAIDALIDAEMSIVDGLDSGVFESRQSLEQAKENLREQYRTPYRLASLQLRAARARSWVGLLARSLLTDWAGSEETTQKDGFVTCMETLSENLAILPSPAATYDQQKEMLRAELAAFEECVLTVE